MLDLLSVLKNNLCMFKKKYFLTGLTVFVLLQLFFYSFLMVFYQKVPFNQYLYDTGFHYIDDNRTQNGSFNIINALSAWDGQWYLRIADAGYTTKAEVDSHQGEKFLDKFAYAFLPLYPALVSITDIPIHNIQISAFILSNSILLAIFFSTYYVVTKLFSREVAMRTNFLLLFFPLGIFYRSYYAESLFLLLLIWFGYFLIKRKWWFVGMLLALLMLTKPNGTFLMVPLFLVLLQEVRKKKIAIWRAAGIFLFPLVTYVYLYVTSKIYMDDGWYWLSAHSYWGPKSPVLQTINSNLQTIWRFSSLPWHVYKSSKSEIIGFFIGLYLLFKSRKMPHPELWYISLSLLLIPLLIKSFTSYARYEMVAFPLFIYLATKLKSWWYEVFISISFVLFLYISLVFINWGWVE